MRQARKQVIPNKLYFRIGEVSDIVGVKPYVLRYWETEFSDVRPTKSKSGQRLYKRRDVEQLMQVKQLLYEERYTIDGAKQRLRETGKIAHSVPVMRDVVTARPMMEEVRDAGDASEDDDDAPVTMGAAEAAAMSGTLRVRDNVATNKLLIQLKKDLQSLLQDIRG